MKPLARLSRTIGLRLECDPHAVPDRTLWHSGMAAPALDNELNQATCLLWFPVKPRRWNIACSTCSSRVLRIPYPPPGECPTPAVPCVVPSLKEIAVEVVQRGTFPVKRRGLPRWHPPSLEDFSPQCPIDSSIAVRTPAGFTGNIRDWLERRRLLHTVEHRWSHADQCEQH